MSVPLYTMAPPPRRNPLSTAPTNHHAINQPYAPPGTPPKPQVQEKHRNPSSPPLPRQNMKVTPPSPPKVITDKSRTVEFFRIGMLGEVSTTRRLELCLSLL